MKTFCFTVDDNIRFFKEITDNHYKSIFDHPYLALYMRLHKKFGLKVQLNLFYKTEGFNLSCFSDRYKKEWQENSDWLKLSFHSDFENERPYEFSDYNEVYEDCNRVNEQIVRFAGVESLAKTTTVHYCLATQEGIKAIEDNKVLGLLGLFGSQEKPEVSYGLDAESAEKIRAGKIVKRNEIHYAAIDVILNNFSKEGIVEKLNGLLDRDGVRVMIHEQYFYKDYICYQPDFEEKLSATFDFLTKNGYKSCFFEDLIL